MGQTVQLGGALAILAGFVLAQLGVVGPRSLAYLVLNLAGSVVLTVDAYLGRQWGFCLMEAVWAVVSAWSLVTLRGPAAPPSGA